MKLPNTKSVSTNLPIVFLGLALILALFVRIDTTAKDVILVIVSGLTGYLSRPDRAKEEVPPKE